MEGDQLFQLIFVLVALIGWVVKSIIEAREERKQRRAPRPSGETKAPLPPAPDDGEVDIVLGRTPLPRPRRTTSVPAPKQPQRAKTAERDYSAEFEPIAGGLEPEIAGRSLGHVETTIEGRPRPKGKKPGDIEERTAAAVSALERGRSEHRAEVLRRLGIEATPKGFRHSVRAAILWSEVIALPRAVTGPHRSPVVRRMRRA